MHLDKLLPLTGAAALLTNLACAQVVPLIPYARTMDLLVVDSSMDGVWRVVDWNQDGDVNDADEVAPFYQDTVGSIVLTNPAAITTMDDGLVLIADTSLDIIVALRDLNFDGDANDAGEHWIWFDSTNAAGLVLPSIGGLHADALGRVFAAVANNGTGGTDQIVMFQDIDGDGNANGVNEAIDYHTVPNAPATGDSIPTEVLGSYDLSLYYSEAGATGVVTKGVYRLTDDFGGGPDGDCNDPGERALFWDTSTIGPNTPFHWGMAIDGIGRFYLSDHSANETVWTAFDSNGNNVIDPGEHKAFYQTGNSTWWDIVVRDDGAVILCEDYTPDRLTLLRDLNGDNDAMDAGEAVEIYNDTVAANGDLRPRGAAFWRAPQLNLVPSTVQIGNPTTFHVRTTQPNELAAVFLSTAVIPPVPLPPFGQAEVDGSAFVVLGWGLANGSGDFSVTFNVPNTATAVGTWGSQAIGGTAYRLFLSNPTLLTVTP